MDSYAIANTMEVLNTTPITDLVTEAIIKVCYVSESANRNGTVITEEVGRKIAASLPGAPVVGLYDEEQQDFVEHNTKISIVDNTIKFVDLTKPYGFVSLEQPWYEDFIEDGVHRKYLMCKAYLWTRQYEEANKIIGKGQSMELDERFMAGYREGDVFVFTDAIIKNLCILGDNYAPCFEGASIMSTYAKQYNTLAEKVENILGRRYCVVNGELKSKEDATYACKSGPKQKEEYAENDSTKKEDVSKESKKDELVKDSTKEENTSKESEKGELIKDSNTDSIKDDKKDSKDSKDSTKSVDNETDKKEMESDTSKKDEEKGKFADNSTKKAKSTDEEDNLIQGLSVENNNQSNPEDSNVNKDTVSAVENNIQDPPESVDNSHTENSAADLGTSTESENSGESVEDGNNEESEYSLKLQELQNKNVELENALKAKNEYILQLEKQLNSYTEKEKNELFNSYALLLSEEELNSIKKESSSLSVNDIESRLALTYAKKELEKQKEQNNNKYQLNINLIDSENDRLPKFMQDALRLDKQGLK